MSSEKKESAETEDASYDKNHRQRNADCMSALTAQVLLGVSDRIAYKKQSLIEFRRHIRRKVATSDSQTPSKEATKKW